MQTVPKPLIETIRRFNRFYTNILGLLNRCMPESDLSLPEARILFELYHGGVKTAKELTGELTIDPGYFSRLIKHLEKQGLVKRVQSQEDGRSYLLSLTDTGKEAFARLDAMSDKQIAGLVAPLSEVRREQLTRGMQAVEDALHNGSSVKGEGIILRSELHSGDVGKLISLHGWIYRLECGYDYGFEGYVCKTFWEFFERYNKDKDRLWFVEDASEMVGAIAIVGHTATKAQLRWFILRPEYRGLGLGSKLMKEALAFCREKGYRDIFLLTTKDQQTAIRMYEKAGFQKVTEQETQMWGKDLTELTYELHIE